MQSTCRMNALWLHQQGLRLRRDSGRYQASRDAKLAGVSIATSACDTLQSVYSACSHSGQRPCTLHQLENRCACSAVTRGSGGGAASIGSNDPPAAACDADHPCSDTAAAWWGTEGNGPARQGTAQVRDQLSRAPSRCPMGMLTPRAQ